MLALTTRMYFDSINFIKYVIKLENIFLWFLWRDIFLVNFVCHQINVCACVCVCVCACVHVCVCMCTEL